MGLANISPSSETNVMLLDSTSACVDIDEEDNRDDSNSVKDTSENLDVEENASSSNSDLSKPSSSPPPSYQHVLDQTKMEENASSTAQNNPILDGAEAGAPEPKKGLQIMHKSHKEFYRAVAKQWGITCKMSDHCRCLDCQSMYFECEFDNNDMEKTDGGLGAGTPMFISEVIHGTACTIL